MDERTEALLHERIAELEGANEQLLEQVQQLEEALDGVREGWRHRRADASLRDDLPVPRLEIEWWRRDDDPYRRWAEYRLVARHLTGRLMAVPIGQTRCDGGDGSWPPTCRDQLDLPFRDGPHIHHDMAHLELPGYVLCGDRTELLPRPEYEFCGVKGHRHRSWAVSTAELPAKKVE